MIKKIAVLLDNLIYRVILKNLLKTSKLGYGFVVTGAEAGTNYEHIYDNKANGKFIIGHYVDRALLNLPAVQATRGRKEDVKKVLWNEILNNQILEKKTRVIDLASGGARYLRELADEHKSGIVESICIDKDYASVQLGKKLLKKDDLKNISFVRGNIFRLKRLKNLGAKSNWIPNVIVASGIFIYFNDDIVEKMLQEIYDVLPVNGLIIFTSYEKIDAKKLMRKTMSTSSGEQWTLYYRKPEFWRKRLIGIGFRDPFIHQDRWGMNNICTARK